MNEPMIDSFFASPQRSSDDEVELERVKLANNPMIKEMLEGFPDLALILNDNRQLVAFNSKAGAYVPPEIGGSVYGLRPGEAVNCIHSYEMPAGCGTSKFCVECGAGQAIVATQQNNRAAVEECRITRRVKNVEESLDLRVHTSLFKVDGKDYTLFSIQDIASEKRRFALERIFFHDILNTAGALHGLISLLPDAEPEELPDIENSLPKISSQLINEILAQRQLLSAESGTLTPEMQSLSLSEILDESGVLYQGHDTAREKKIVVVPLKNEVSFTSDKTLLVRSIGNLIKNALEASHKGDEVRISAEVSSKEIFFNVWNNTVMPLSVQVQMFQRSFSTKSPKGRGIGTYSVKLIVEQYLKGRVTFVSDEEQKTIFTITVPR